MVFALLAAGAMLGIIGTTALILICRAIEEKRDAAERQAQRERQDRRNLKIKMNERREDLTRRIIEAEE